MPGNSVRKELFKGGVQGKFFWRIRFELWAPQVPLIIGKTFGEQFSGSNHIVHSIKLKGNGQETKPGSETTPITHDTVPMYKNPYTHYINLLLVLPSAQETKNTIKELLIYWTIKGVDHSDFFWL